MPRRFTARALAVLALATAGCTAGTGPLGARVVGEARAVFGANATLYAVPEAAGFAEIGFELPLAAIEAAPDAGETTITTLRFSEAVRQATFLDHLDIDYNPRGHEPPGTYDTPHFDFHFYGVDEATKQAIDCKDETAPAAARVPAGDAFLPPPKGPCVPMMGIHASELSSPELAQPSPAPFTRTMVLGFYAGRQIFIEPMATRAFLLTKQDFTLPVGRPAELGRQTLYPSTFRATFDAAKNAWVFALRDWQATTR